MMKNETDNNWNDMQSALTRLGEHLQKPTRLVLIGSSVGMFYGQPGRMTEDVDVWSPKSKVDIADIIQACHKAGIAFDPREYDKPNEGLYIQMIQPGIVHVGQWKNETQMFTTGNLTVAHPPAQNIIASKLGRCTDTDVEDIVFLMRESSISMDSVREAISTLPQMAKNIASENMVLLEIRLAALSQNSKTLEKAPLVATSTDTTPARPRRRP
jgi:hypothetical protein